MRIERLHVRSFRCLDDLEVEFDERITVLVGANSTGKSSVLHALRWFFAGGALDPADVGGECADTVSVAVTFTDLTSADLAAFREYVVDGRLQLCRTWDAEGSGLTARTRTYPPFDEVRREPSANALRASYRQLSEQHPELGLRSARSAAEAHDAMTTWEGEHQAQLVVSERDASSLFAGPSRLKGRFDFVLVSASADPAQETRDAPRTLLRQHLDRSGAHAERIRERLDALQDRLARDVQTVLDEEAQDAFGDLSATVSAELAVLVPQAAVTFTPRPPAIQLPNPGVDLRVTDGGHESDVARQGHGFQRALFITLVQLLARAPQGGDPPGLFLALEEPELFQHPVQARHFARTLTELARTGEGAVQVAYATHSEHFVDPSHYERLRRFCKEQTGRNWPTARVTQATIERVTERVNSFMDPAQIPGRVRTTMRRQLSEAVFAAAVLLVEGDTDLAVLQGIAEREAGLDAAGLAVVAAGSKSRLPLPLAILEELGVPTYVVFDGDADLRDRMIARGKSDSDAANELRNTTRQNTELLGLLGATHLGPTPDTTVTPTFTVFRNEIEAELATWTGFQLALGQLRSADASSKSEDLYRQAAAEALDDPPQVLIDLLDAAAALPQRSLTIVVDDSLDLRLISPDSNTDHARP